MFEYFECSDDLTFVGMDPVAVSYYYLYYYMDRYNAADFESDYWDKLLGNC